MSAPAVPPFALAAHAGFVGGAWVTTGSEPGAVDVVNPADGSVVAKLPNMGRDATEQAVRAARAAFPAWAARPAADRGAVLRRLHDLMGQNVDGEVVVSCRVQQERTNRRRDTALCRVAASQGWLRCSRWRAASRLRRQRCAFCSMGRNSGARGSNSRRRGGSPAVGS